MRVVLDTNVLVRAAKPSPNPAREVLHIVRSEPHDLLVSLFLLGEVDRVLRYPRVQAQHQLTEEEMQAFVADLKGIAVVVDLGEGPPLHTTTTDPDDNPILQTAVYGQARVLGTRDRHFHHPEIKAFCAQHGVQVLTEVELLRFLQPADQ